MAIEDFPTQEVLLKHFYDHKHIFSFDDIKKKIEMYAAKELSESFLDKNLENSQYRALSFLDFQKFDKLLRQRRLSDMISWTEQKFIEYKKAILAGVTNGTLPPPIILHDLSGKYILFSGEARMLAFKVLGIRPLVKIIEIDQVLTFESNYLENVA